MYSIAIDCELSCKNNYAIKALQYYWRHIQFSKDSYFVLVSALPFWKIINITIIHSDI